MNGHPDRARRLAAIAAAHDDWAKAHAGQAAFDPVRARKKPGSDYNQHYLDVNPPAGAEEDFHRRVAQAAQPALSPQQRGASMPATRNGQKRMPVVRGAADVQLSRSGPGKITAMHKSTGMKIGTITAQGNGWAGTHADGKATGPSGSQQGALSGLIAWHNQQAAKARAAAGGKAGGYANGGRAAVDLAGALPVTTPAVSSGDGPRVTTAGAGKPAAAPGGGPAGLSPYAMALYKKFIPGR